MSHGAVPARVRSRPAAGRNARYLLTRARRRSYMHAMLCIRPVLSERPSILLDFFPTTSRGPDKTEPTHGVQHGHSY